MWLCNTGFDLLWSLPLREAGGWPQGERSWHRSGSLVAAGHLCPLSMGQSQMTARARGPIKTWLVLRTQTDARFILSTFLRGCHAQGETRGRKSNLHLIAGVTWLERWLWSELFRDCELYCSLKRWLFFLHSHVRIISMIPNLSISLSLIHAQINNKRRASFTLGTVRLSCAED